MYATTENVEMSLIVHGIGGKEVTVSYILFDGSFYAVIHNGKTMTGE